MIEKNNVTEPGQTEANLELQKKSPSAVKIIKMVITVILLIIVAFLAVVAVKIAFDKFILKKTVPSFAGYSLLWVDTGSMEPTIMEGDLILIKNTGDYWTGDVITFIHPGQTIPTTHRIIDFADDTRELYTTRGDNSKNSKDPLPVHKDQVFGEVVLVMHGLGLFVSWLVKGGGFVFAIAVVLIIGLAIFLLSDGRKTIDVGQPSENKLEENEKEDEPEQSADTAPDSDASADEGEII